MELDYTNSRVYFLQDYLWFDALTIGMVCQSGGLHEQNYRSAGDRGRPLQHFRLLFT